MIFLYALFVLSIIFPIYTYAIYPIILRFLRQKQYAEGNFTPYVSIVVLGSDFDKKRENLNNINYLNYEVLKSGNLNDSINEAKGEIILFTDDKSELDPNALIEIVKPFADERIDGVVGMQTNKKENSAYWTYENYVRRMESKIGCVSGANDTVFAVRKAKIPDIPNKIKNKMFYISTMITQSGKDVVFMPTAIAYESPSIGMNFEKHISDASGYWQAFMVFWRMLLPRRGHFVYIGHRVMKWFVCLNMIVALVTSAILASISPIMLVILLVQIFGYALVAYAHNRDGNGVISKLLALGRYFVALNLAYFYGALQLIWRCKND